MTKLVAWDRLVRYRPAGSDEIRYGQPILEPGQTDQVARLAAEGVLEVEILQGADPLTAIPTNRCEKVEKLLGPLTPGDVPIVRCIGLNYKTHSTLRLLERAKSC
jgi:hypothetical protein